jgi:hypothetical protein
MRIKYCYIALLAILLCSCEEYYKPDLDVVPGLMVVESHLTNDPNQNFVKLTKMLDFYSTKQEEKVSGAKVELVEINGQTTKGIESSTGYFTFPTTPVSGKKYVLRITYIKDVFESDPVIMPPIPTIDTLYTNHKLEKSYRLDVYGGPTQVMTPGRDICIDAPISSSLEYYRFNWRAVIQWEYYLLPPPEIPPPPYFGWISIYQKGQFNIAGPKQFSISDQVKNHPVLFLGYDSRAYLDSVTQIPKGWIVIIDQYGISKESYDFHEKLNKQISAEGTLFDPVLTQVYGNIHCRTNSKTIVAGFFDLNSYRQYRYFLDIGMNEKSNIVQRRLNRYLIIPDKGYLRGITPAFWENHY